MSAMNPSLIPVAPGMETPLEMLEACHERLQSQLTTLSRLVPWLAEHGVDGQARQAAVNIMRYFDLAAVNHHLDEEEDLIPALRGHADEADGPALEALIEWMLADHQRMFAAWAQMRQKLEAISHGEAVTLGEEEVAGFAQRYRDHIAREESELLPLSRRLLTEEDIAHMSVRMVARRRVPQ